MSSNVTRDPPRCHPPPPSTAGPSARARAPRPARSALALREPEARPGACGRGVTPTRVRGPRAPGPQTAPQRPPRLAWPAPQLRGAARTGAAAPDSAPAAAPRREGEGRVGTPGARAAACLQLICPPLYVCHAPEPQLRVQAPEQFRETRDWRRGAARVLLTRPWTVAGASQACREVPSKNGFQSSTFSTGNNSSVATNLREPEFLSFTE